MVAGPPTTLRIAASSITTHNSSGSSLVRLVARSMRACALLSITEASRRGMEVSMTAAAYSKVCSRPGTVEVWYCLADNASASKLM